MNLSNVVCRVTGSSTNMISVFVWLKVKSKECTRKDQRYSERNKRRSVFILNWDMCMREQECVTALAVHSQAWGSFLSKLAEESVLLARRPLTRVSPILLPSHKPLIPSVRYLFPLHKCTMGCIQNDFSPLWLSTCIRVLQMHPNT